MTNPNASPLDEVLCRTPGCRRRSVSRGICEVCEWTAAQLIASRETTEAELVDLGLLLPADMQSGVFRAAFEAAVKRKQFKD